MSEGQRHKCLKQHMPYVHTLQRCGMVLQRSLLHGHLINILRCTCAATLNGQQAGATCLLQVVHYCSTDTRHCCRFCKEHQFLGSIPTVPTWHCFSSSCSCRTDTHKEAAGFKQFTKDGAAWLQHWMPCAGKAQHDSSMAPRSNWKNNQQDNCDVTNARKS